mgnify:CR=1 FL=1
MFKCVLRLKNDFETKERVKGFTASFSRRFFRRNMIHLAIHRTKRRGLRDKHDWEQTGLHGEHRLRDRLGRGRLRHNTEGGDRDGSDLPSRSESRLVREGWCDRSRERCDRSRRRTRTHTASTAQDRRTNGVGALRGGEAHRKLIEGHRDGLEDRRQRENGLGRIIAVGRGQRRRDGARGQGQLRGGLQVRLLHIRWIDHFT